MRELILQISFIFLTLVVIPATYADFPNRKLFGSKLLDFDDRTFYIPPTSSCPRIDISNGRITLRSGRRVAKIRCYSGFSMYGGDRRLECVRNKWIGKVPLCIKNGCPPLRIENGRQFPIYSGAVIHFACHDGLELIGSPLVYCNGWKWNDTAPLCQIPESKPDHTSCNFEKGFCSWTQDDLDNFNWKWGRPSLSTRANDETVGGPKVDHTLGTPAGHYIYTDNESVNRGGVGRLFSPMLDTPSETPACAVFYYNMHTTKRGELKVFVQPKGVPFEMLVAGITFYGSTDENSHRMQIRNYKFKLPFFTPSLKTSTTTPRNFESTRSSAQASYTRSWSHYKSGANYPENSKNSTSKRSNSIQKQDNEVASAQTKWKLGFIYIYPKSEKFQVILESRDGGCAVDDFKIISGPQCLDYEMKLFGYSATTLSAQNTNRIISTEKSFKSTTERNENSRVTSTSNASPKVSSTVSKTFQTSTYSKLRDYQTTKFDMESLTSGASISTSKNSEYLDKLNTSETTTATFINSTKNVFDFISQITSVPAMTNETKYTGKTTLIRKSTTFQPISSYKPSLKLNETDSKISTSTTPHSTKISSSEKNKKIPIYFSISTKSPYTFKIITLFSTPTLVRKTLTPKKGFERFSNKISTKSTFNITTKPTELPDEDTSSTSLANKSVTIPYKINTSSATSKEKIFTKIVTNSVTNPAIIKQKVSKSWSHSTKVLTNKYTKMFPSKVTNFLFAEELTTISQSIIKNKQIFLSNKTTNSIGNIFLPVFSLFLICMAVFAIFVHLRRRRTGRIRLVEEPVNNSSSEASSSHSSATNSNRSFVEIPGKYFSSSYSLLKESVPEYDA